MRPIPLYVGYDPREAAAYHVFCQSVIEHSSVPVAFHPLHKGMLGGFDGQKDGTNAFIYSRFLVPYLQNYEGWALFVDGDMVVTDDIAVLWAERERNCFDKGVCVVKHDYQTQHPRKYLGTAMESANEDYPCKNQSSVILWNCAHYRNRILNPESVADRPGSDLHRFKWLKESQVGSLPREWNALSGEQDVSGASLIHYTLGIPAFDHYKHCDGADHWHRFAKSAMRAG
jgi:lipopolysaccharide biosynthesis glycosyltransferase